MRLLNFFLDSFCHVFRLLIVGIGSSIVISGLSLIVFRELLFELRASWIGACKLLRPPIYFRVWAGILPRFGHAFILHRVHEFDGEPIRYNALFEEFFSSLRVYQDLPALTWRRYFENIFLTVENGSDIFALESLVIRNIQPYFLILVITQLFQIFF